MRLDNTKQLAHGTELLLPFVLLLQMVPRYSRNRDLHAIGLVGYLSQVRLRVSTRSHNVPDLKTGSVDGISSWDARLL